jgi:hypothetical protein
MQARKPYSASLKVRPLNKSKGWPTSISSHQSPRMTTPNPLIDGMMKVARLAAAAQCANAPEGPAPSAQVHAEGFDQALRALRAACPLPFEKVPPFKWSLPRRAVDDWGLMNCTTITVRI